MAIVLMWPCHFQTEWWFLPLQSCNQWRWNRRVGFSEYLSTINPSSMAFSGTSSSEPTFSKFLNWNVWIVLFSGFKKSWFRNRVTVFPKIHLQRSGGFVLLWQDPSSWAAISSQAGRQACTHTPVCSSDSMFLLCTEGGGERERERERMFCGLC